MQDATSFARRAQQSRAENTNNNPASLYENKPQTGHNHNLLHQRFGAGAAGAAGAGAAGAGNVGDDGVPLIPMKAKKDKNSYYAAARKSAGLPNGDDSKRDSATQVQIEALRKQNLDTLNRAVGVLGKTDEVANATVQKMDYNSEKMRKIINTTDDIQINLAHTDKILGHLDKGMVSNVIATTFAARKKEAMYAAIPRSHADLPIFIQGVIEKAGSNKLYLEQYTKKLVMVHGDTISFFEKQGRSEAGSFKVCPKTQVWRFTDAGAPAVV